MHDFWQLPGPAAFTRDVAEDLRAGNNVVLVFPDHCADGWLGAFRAEIRELGLPRLQEIAPNGSPPVEAIHSQLNLGDCPPRASASHLCGIDAFHMRLLHVQDFTESSWEAWRAFLGAYEDACRQVDLVQRTLFVTTLRGELALRAPESANLLRLHRWPCHVDGLNIRLHAAALLSATQLWEWQRQLAVELLASLSLWDPEICALGASKPLSEIIAPGSWLAELARSRNWSPKEQVKAPSAEWRGLRQVFEGRDRIHSAWLALAGRHEALDHRLWTGQVAALFPLLESHRRDLLKYYRGVLRVPWTTAFTRIEFIEDLELNHIADQLRRQSSRGLSEATAFVSWLRDLRNDLAHLKSIPPERLLEQAFASRMTKFLTSEDE